MLHEINHMRERRQRRSRWFLHKGAPARSKRCTELRHAAASSKNSTVSDLQAHAFVHEVAIGTTKGEPMSDHHLPVRSPGTLPSGERPPELTYAVPLEGREGIHWARVLHALRRYKWLVAGMTVLGALVGIVATRFVAAEYKVSATLWIDNAGRPIEHSISPGGRCASDSSSNPPGGSISSSRTRCSTPSSGT